MRALDENQQSLENETRAKGEAIRMKKKLESDINELDIALEHANGSNAEAQRTIKRYQAHIKESQSTLEHEQIMRDKMRENLIQSERQALHADLEEMLGETRLSEEKAKKAMIDA